MPKTYSIVECFSTIQGEGRHAGCAAIFLRFAGCNLWNGSPDDRVRGVGACAMWCDTYFAKGTKMSIAEILTRMEALWPSTIVGRMVVLTGGEPTLQVDIDLVKALKHEDWYVAIETNGTNNIDAIDIIDHVCVSPKRGSQLQVWQAEELKVVLPGGVAGAPPEHQWAEAELIELGLTGSWGGKYVQPQDVTDVTTVEKTALTISRKQGVEPYIPVNYRIYDQNVALCVEFIKRHPDWRLSLQGHKYIGLR